MPENGVNVTVGFGPNETGVCGSSGHAKYTVYLYSSAKLAGFDSMRALQLYNESGVPYLVPGTHYLDICDGAGTNVTLSVVVPS